MNLTEALSSNRNRLDNGLVGIESAILEARSDNSRSMWCGDTEMQVHLKCASKRLKTLKIDFLNACCSFIKMIGFRISNRF